MTDKYTVVQDPYCFQGLDVLRNKAGITDALALEQLEGRLSRARIEQYTPDFTEFSLATLQKIHFFLFQDLYDWAGQIRMVDISKGATRFANMQHIVREANRLFSHLQQENCLQNLDLTVFAARLADYYCELNVLHPFRDGNGRAQRLFFEVLAINAGYTMNWSCIAADEWLQANIAGYYGKLQPLEYLMQRAIQPILES